MPEEKLVKSFSYHNHVFDVYTKWDTYYNTNLFQLRENGKDLTLWHYDSLQFILEYTETLIKVELEEHDL